MPKQKRQDIRCGHCDRKLAEGSYYSLSIKCPRCKTLNLLTVTRTAKPALLESLDQRISHGNNTT
ncbi:MAG: Com family DNA-binding transcriptional regulator [Gammaproteobacteria bacterium]|nr:MAG: Com family DNA-binding transcriptional regulator [Gammaproteobacteria bacterium]